jgi:hypothetical protein
VTELLVIVAAASLFVVVIYAAYLDPTATALRALHQALERGEISPDQYAHHLQSLERSV